MTAVDSPYQYHQGAVVETEPERWPERRNESSSAVTTRLRGEIVFDRVSFDYGDGKEVLREVSFAISPP